ncbi:MAG TPA: ATPase, T2SS/T4P/T4SS family [Acidimicrobiia bacterium]|nr:ATPase, T2SS/T4P/T4SS family [Acidimicrobiia bacterium]
MIRSEEIAAVRAEVAQRLSSPADPADDTDIRGFTPPGDPERVMARHVIADILEEQARQAILAGQPVRSPEDEDALAQAVYDALFGLGSLQRWLDDPDVTDVHVQGCDTVFVVRGDGTKEQVDPVAGSDDELVELIRMAAARMGRSERRFDVGNPELNLQLPDGSRLFAVMGVSARPSLAIRRHRFPKVFLSDLVGLGALDETLADFLSAAVRARKNIVVAGGTGMGKTTLLRALINEVPPHERLITVEDSLELGLDRFPELHPDVVTLEAREANVEGEGAIPLDRLVRMGLRMDPDRVIVGEVRGDEILPMLNAMSQGNDGSMCTVHAHSSEGVFRKLAMYAMQTPQRLPLEATNLLVANALDFVVHLGCDAGGDRRRSRYVTSVREVVDADGAVVTSNEVFRPGPDGRAIPGVPMRTTTLRDLLDAGLDDERFHLHATPGGWR